jgi:predicted transcriptional regulator
MEEIRSGNIKPTKIMYAGNLSWKPLQQMLKSLVNQELIEEFEADEHDKRSSKVYGLTQKGQNVIQYFSEVKRVLEKKKPVEVMNWR